MYLGLAPYSGSRRAAALRRCLQLAVCHRWPSHLPPLVQVAAQFELRGSQLRSRANGRVFQAGVFSTPSLGKLRAAGIQHLASVGHGGRGPVPPGQVGQVEVVHEAVDDILAEHYRRPGALFQAASQFNCLEFVGPSVTPEDGITVRVALSGDAAFDQPPQTNPHSSDS